MIVISQSLTLATLEQEPATHPLIGWQNRVTVNNIESDTEEPDHPATNLANHNTALKWVGGGVQQEHISVGPGTSDDIDYIAIAGHNWASGHISVAVEHLIAGSPQEWEELIPDVMLAKDGVVLFRFEPQPINEIRLRLGAGLVAPQASVVYVGKLLVFERGVQGNYTPLPLGRVANVVTGRAESGDFLGRIITNSRLESSAQFIGLTPGWVRTKLDPFLEVSAGRPFFFSWSPVEFPADVGFGWATNDPQPSLTLEGYAEVTLNMGGVVT